MGTYSGGHDAYAVVGSTTQQLSVSSATGTSTTAFGTQTRAVRIVVLGTATSTAGVYTRFYNLGQLSQADSTVDVVTPLNWVDMFKVTPGQRASFIAGEAASYRVHLTEVTD